MVVAEAAAVGLAGAAAAVLPGLLLGRGLFRLLRATAAALDRPLRRGVAGELALVRLRARPSPSAGP
ncbi:hypothetical protein [Spirilliplanes yamanashiensis]|uniref:Uncharacterized protein n=2 Tax=Spirilliplanes yamanashiensis TaxID=42233 RepID=A0A8J4DK82_9ACTN|nr:hypothetical protein [Spirilliplanes yamanashiensis]MDP9817806.1 ABC-type uncharacterized transport system YnjBCD permease subunit [Spirilliplanes yamanashiensis]GIJ04616.1 hypothetical protein Sya03_39680 [Spirilliplanes yamanashiensis]